MEENRWISHAEDFSDNLCKDFILKEVKPSPPHLKSEQLIVISFQRAQNRKGEGDK